MGQYYNILFGDKTGNNKKLYETEIEYENKMKGFIGLKLMEHSYMDNELMKAVGAKLLDSPKRILWAGDYSDENNEADYNIIKENLNFNNHITLPKYNDAWPENKDWSKPLPPLQAHPNFSFEYLYLLNHDKKMFINMDKYIKANTTKCVNWLTCICPISLLTAIGNGKGGGDYYGTDMDEISSWAWNLISLSKTFPEGYEELEPIFKEYA